MPLAVAMRQRTLDRIGQDLHVAMRMRAEARPGRDPVLVDHAQAVEAEPARVAKLSEREAVPAVEPVRTRPTPFFAAMYPDHPCLLSRVRSGMPESTPGFTPRTVR